MTKKQKPTPKTEKLPFSYQSGEFIFKFILSFVVIVTILFIISLFTNRPNYRDLNHIYGQLQIPGDWTINEQHNETGAWGLACLDIGDVTCPAIYSSFSKEGSFEKQKQLASISKVATSLKPTIKNGKCSQKMNSCTYTVVSGNIAIRISASAESDDVIAYSIMVEPKNESTID